MYQLDVRVFLWMNRFGARFPTVGLAFAWLSTLAPLLFGLLFGLYFFAVRSNVERMRKTVLLAGLAGVLAVLVSVVMGRWLYRDRPFVALPPGQVWMPLAHSPDSSFPSDHTVGSAAFFAGMWNSPHRSARWTFLCVTLLVAISRPVIGVHWPSDILASWILGVLCAIMVFRLQPMLEPVLDFALDLVQRAEQRMGRS